MKTITEALGIGGLVLASLTGCHSKPLDAPKLSDCRKINAVKVGPFLQLIDLDQDWIVDLVDDERRYHIIRSYINPNLRLTEETRNKLHKLHINSSDYASMPKMDKKMIDAANAILRNYQFLSFQTAIRSYDSETQSLR